jgi:DNA processing protein
MPVPILKLGKLPRRLEEINDRPKYLYMRGVLPSEDDRWLCVVGSRKYSPYGRSVCDKLINGLAGTNVVIVSGLALGIDSIAHEAALQAGLKTVGVPGSGLSPDVLYPSTSKDLAERIVAEGGALISEFEPMFKATAWSFPKRNRIMAGLSDAILVIEAELRSGTLITARLAADYNRDVLAVPGGIYSEGSAGPHMLIQKGAALIDSPSALKTALGITNEDLGELRDYSSCSSKEHKILIALSVPISKDKLIEIVDMPVSEIYATLTSLEIKGFIKEELGEVRKT